MSMFSKITDKLKSAANTAYDYILPKPAREYAKAGIKAVGRLVKDVVIDGLAALWVTIKSFSAGVPASSKSLGSAIKTLFWDLPKVGYYKSQGDEEKAKAALQQAQEDTTNAANQWYEAVSTITGTAYEGLKPILSDVATSIAYNGGEAILDAGAIASIGLIEGGKVVNNYVLTPVATQLNNHVVTPLASRLAEATSTLAIMAAEQGSAAYNALPSLSTVKEQGESLLLLGYNAVQAAQGNKVAISQLQEIEMPVINALKAATAA